MPPVRAPPGRRVWGACFIAGIIAVSLLSRLARAFELRVTDMELDAMAERFVRDTATRRIRFIANEPDNRDPAEYRDKTQQIRADNDIPAEEDLVFVEVTVRDPSDFESAVRVRGEVLHGRYRVLTLDGSSIPNSLAALLLHVRDETGYRPHIYFEWTEGAPSPSCCASSCSARERSPPPPAKSSAKPNPTAPAVPTSTSADAFRPYATSLGVFVV